MPKVASEPLPPGATAGQIAAVLGVTERVVTARRQDGRLPRLENGQIDLHAVIRAGVAKLAEARKAAAEGDEPGAAADLDANRSRESRLRGDILELKREMLRAELVPADLMEGIVGAAFDAARAKLLAIPAAYGPRLAAEGDPHQARELLTKAIHDALGDLADGEVIATVKERTRVAAGRVEGGDAPVEEAGAAA